MYFCDSASYARNFELNPYTDEERNKGKEKGTNLESLIIIIQKPKPPTQQRYFV